MDSGSRERDCCASGNREVKRVPFDSDQGRRQRTQQDFVAPYVDDLQNVIDMDAIRGAALRSASIRSAVRGVALLGADRASYGLKLDGREQARSIRRFRS